MLYFLTKSANTRPLATVLALVALLAVLSSQAVELVHQHDFGDVTENCLLCKADGGSAIAVPEETTQNGVFTARTPSYTPVSFHGAPRAAHLARGPPKTS